MRISAQSRLEGKNKAVIAAARKVANSLSGGQVLSIREGGGSNSFFALVVDGNRVVPFHGNPVDGVLFTFPHTFTLQRKKRN